MIKCLLLTADPPFAPSDTLKTWHERTNCWLELSDVHKETTENVRVTVIPFYMGCRTSQNTTVYWVNYLVEHFEALNWLSFDHNTWKETAFIKI